MLRGYRGILTALAGLILAGAQQPSETRQTQDSSQQTQASTTEGVSPTPTPEPPYRPYPDYNPDPCYNAQNHDTADLCAQWRAAIAAEKTTHEARRATNWAIVATFLSFIGVAALVVTLWQTQGALNEARRGNLIAQKGAARATRRAIEGAKETEAALKVARQNAKAAKLNAKVAERAIAENQRIGEAQVRCYLRAAECTLRHVGTHWLLGAKITNTGRSPAKFISWNPTLTIYDQRRGEIRKILASKLPATLFVEIASNTDEQLPACEFLPPLVPEELETLAIGQRLAINAKLAISGRDVFGRDVSCEATFTCEITSIAQIGVVLLMSRSVGIAFPDEWQDLPNGDNR